MLLDQIKADLTVAMKAGDPLRLSVLRMLSSELNYKQIEVQRELTEEDVVGVVNKEAKKRREAIESYTKAGRVEQARSEEKELVILSAYLPRMLSEEEVRSEINKLDLPSDFGQAMKIASPMFRGKADGGMVARIVKERLGL